MLLARLAGRTAGTQEEISMAVKALSHTQLDELESGLKKLVPAGAAAAPIEAIDIQGIEKEFCAIWPKARPVVLKIAEYVRCIPKV
jgi:hypothetical protein